MLELSNAGHHLSRGAPDLTDNRIDASGALRASGASSPSGATIASPSSSVDEPYPGLPAPVNDLVVTVLAPAAALSHANGQIRATGMDGLFVSDARALTEVRLRFGGAEPHPLAVL